ncbi:MAG: SAM-dependent methyltransferase [Azonexus sp.]|nr:SAM-dependent methyltransferase [Azonexus sp.]
MIPPSPWVEAHAACLPAGRLVLDLACGHGRHSRLLAAGGWPVLAVDRDASVLAVLRGVAGIVVTNYLWRPRLPDLLALLAPGGVLIYETFMDGNAAYGKPTNPDFLLRPGELRAVAAAAGLREIAFAEGYVERPKPAMRQAICAVRE